MEKTPIVAFAPEGTFKLKEIKPTTSLPGIERTESETHV
jgi:myo-inositol-1-phosphate synthase